MKKNKRMSSLILVCTFILFIFGCATIIHGGRQDIPVTSSPSGSIVRVNRIVVSTPGVINLSRKEPMYILRFEKEGYEPVEVKLIRTTDGWIWGNILIGGLIGLAIDYSSGAAYQLTPKEVNVTLKSLGYQEKRETKVEEREETKEEIKEEAKEDRMVVVDTQKPIPSYSEYYRLLYRTISKAAIKPEGSAGGTVSATFTLLSDGTLEEIRILDGSSEDVGLRNAVEKATRDSAPFPAFPVDIKKEKRKTFTITIEFRYR